MILYTKTVCPECVYAKGFLATAGVTPEVVNIDKDTQYAEKLKSLGISGVPVLEHNGNIQIKIENIKEYIKNLTGKNIDY